MDTFLTPLAGGVLIGLSAVLLMALNGRVAGISGILGGLLPPDPAADRGWRLAFLAGLVAAPPAVAWATGAAMPFHLAADMPTLVVGGLLVGFGTVVGSGCTSGHGVCGISRLSLRGMVATVFYILAGGITIVLFRHILGVI